MKGSVLAIAMFAIGIAVAHFGIVPEYFVAHAQDLALYTLYGLIALIGFEFGHDAMVDNLKKLIQPCCSCRYSLWWEHSQPLWP